MLSESLARLRQETAYEMCRREICAKSGVRCSEGRRIFYAAANPLLSADDVEFMTADAGKNGRACALTGRFGGEGFFSGVYSDSRNAAEKLMRAVLKRQNDWGVRRVTGPVSPAYVDLEGGWPVSGFDEEVSRFSRSAPEYMDDVMTACGFRADRRFLLYKMAVSNPAYARYEAVSEWSMRRFGYRVVSAGEMGERAAERAMASVLAREPLLGMNAGSLGRVLDALGRNWSRPMTQIALAGGEPVAYLLALYDRKSNIARAATVQVRTDWQRRAVTAALGVGLLRAARKCRFIECGVVDETNAASRYGLENAGSMSARRIESYIYEK